MKKVLQVSMGESFGGIEKLMSVISENITDVKIDNLTPINIDDNWYNLNISRKNLRGKITYNYRLYKFLKENKYDIIHIHTSVFLFSFQVALIAKLTKTKTIIAHAHSIPKISILKKIIIKILSPLYKRMTTCFLSCSSEAIKGLNTKNFIQINNGIDVKLFKYNNQKRLEYRKKLKLDNKFVYGNVSSFDKNKNHDFLIDLFYEIQKKQDAALLLIGDGQLKNNIKNKVVNLNLTDKVIFLDFQNNINDYLNCMDYFLFPSFTEGLGIASIESQTNGLPTFVSKGIPREANISSYFYQINNYNIDDWLNTISKVKNINRKNAYKQVINSNYDIKDVCEKLKQIYKVK